MGSTLYDKVFDLHTVRSYGDGRCQLFIGLHLVHEATSPQAFAMLRERGLPVLMPERNVATADHVIPTDTIARPFLDQLGEDMLTRLEENTTNFGLRFLSPGSGEYGIVHVVGPEQGLTQPGMTIACGDSHTSTHGAFGAVALGIGTSQVRDVLATQTVTMNRLKVRRIQIDGELNPGVTAKDVILHIIHELGVVGGVGYAYEFAGEVIEAMSMDERMTICNMAVEGGARCGYVNPDEKTFEFLKGRPAVPTGEAWDRAVTWWKWVASDADAEYDDVVLMRGADIRPMVTWGINLEQSVPIDGLLPQIDETSPEAAASFAEAYDYMGMKPGTSLSEYPIDVAFIGSCTNGRVSDFVEVATALERSGAHVAPGVRALAVPGSNAVREELIRRGIDKVLEKAGFEFRLAGCSMCLAMNPDKLVGQELAASSSNRNFKGRQGSPTGRTMILSPLAVAAAAVNGSVCDPTSVFGQAVTTPDSEGVLA
ncbi:3-isopropylmalate dehydratase large subunit [Actinokineospora xionganensis]|uniref:3-isopropylmalate dehydratase n=1 Tax=Actinokineospora xionganensis TaxID=2684470 RepID=A0ABR7L4G4_9PSEU|nr:3-isopropylmalate dehydratase large subunit [Actinokineospora xionganensis]MBC6447413.1 3-isopropylmalate dehydratase large subunit [Actinokineospora xionganensis]